jgi:hypothetical protein
MIESMMAISRRRGHYSYGLWPPVNATPRRCLRRPRERWPLLLCPSQPDLIPVLVFSWPWLRPGPWEGSRRRRGRPDVSGLPTPPEMAEHDCKGRGGPPHPGAGPLSPLRPFWPALASRWPHEPKG